ncbi:FR1L5 protein, partial [Centropus bengalensis]|nr:FR1L5 protein [Centropus bengalensis]
KPPDPNPMWNEIFFFPLRLPPICEEIQLAILSGSCGSKVLATATLQLSHISSAGADLEGEQSPPWAGGSPAPRPPPPTTEPHLSLLEGTPGFLPCFGPSFLPFYGPRPDCARMGDTAYQGRVLLELRTHLGTPDGRQKDTISPEDIAQVQRHLSHHQFGLCGVFYSATMVPAGPELLRFEVSIGNYGDTGDATCKPAASVTPWACPVFDGHRYHSMPWDGDKPVVAVTSSWEDSSHRWVALNLLRALNRRLVSTGG